MPRVTMDECARFHIILDECIAKMNSEKNSKKAHWSGISVRGLFGLYSKEVQELTAAVIIGRRGGIQDELKDVINFAMMMYDNTNENE